MKHIWVFGPAGSGKSTNAAALAKAFRAVKVLDEFSMTMAAWRQDLRDQPGRRLVMAQAKPDPAIADDFTVISIAAALRQIAVSAAALPSPLVGEGGAQRRMRGQP